jgi:uncharacterized surface protein with fasciclin (FAS1) repeats
MNGHSHHFRLLVVHINSISAVKMQLKLLYRSNRFTLQVMQAMLSANKFLNMSTIVDVVVADKNLSTMLRGVKAAGLEIELSKTGPFTVFAPSEMAFGKLAQGQLAELLKPENKVQLTGLLQQHVVEGKNNFKDFTDGQKLKTLSGKELDVKVSNGTVTINGAKIQGRDHDASNGVVHSLDAVLSAN